MQPTACMHRCGSKTNGSMCAVEACIKTWTSPRVSWQKRQSELSWSTASGHVSLAAHAQQQPKPRWSCPAAKVLGIPYSSPHHPYRKVQQGVCALQHLLSLPSSTGSGESLFKSTLPLQKRQKSVCALQHLLELPSSKGLTKSQFKSTLPLQTREKSMCHAASAARHSSKGFGRSLFCTSPLQRRGK